ncbi:MAG: BUG/TctC family periplasmic protein, partial [uncultured Solirubrobacteraceae bacterium]
APPQPPRAAARHGGGARSRRSRRRLDRLCAGPSHACRLARAFRADHRPRRRRRQPGHRRPPARPAPDGGARPERRGREPARRRQQHRLRTRRAGAAGRVHAARWLRQPVHQQGAVPAPVFRPGGGLRAGGPRGSGAADPRGARRPPRAHAGGFPPARAPRRGGRRHAGQRQPRAPAGRGGAGSGRGALDPRALPRRCAGGERPARRLLAGRAHQHRRGDGPRARRAHARPVRRARL